MPTTKRIFLFSLPLLALIVLGAAFYSSSSDAHPKERVLSVLWEPEEVTLTLAPDNTETIQVEAVISCRHPKLFVDISPELAPYVSVAPSVVDKCKNEKHRNSDSDSRYEIDRGDNHRRGFFKKRWRKERGVNTVIFDITTEIPANVDPQTFEGTIQLVSRKSSSETLPVVVNVWQQTTSSDGEDTYSISTPPSLIAKEFESGTLGIYPSEEIYLAGIPATVGINIYPISAGTTLLETAENTVSASVGESVWTQNIDGREFVVHNEALGENMEIIVFTTYFSATKYLEIVAPTKVAQSDEFITMLASLETDI